MTTTRHRQTNFAQALNKLGLGLGLEEDFVFDSKSENRLGLGFGSDLHFAVLVSVL